MVRNFLVTVIVPASNNITMVLDPLGTPSRRATTLALSLAACSIQGDTDEASWRASAVAPSLDDAHWAVGTLDLATSICPDLSSKSWALVGTRMFLDGSAGLSWVDPPLAIIPDFLLRFCLYRWVGSPGVPPLPSHPSLHHVSLDSAVVRQMGNGLDQEYRPELRDVFIAQAGGVWEHAPASAYPVTVAVVDSESEFAELAPHIDHASSMASVIETLTCPWDATDCTVSTYRALGLPVLETGELRPDGGYYGARAHVAMGIVESVLAWRQSLTDGATSRLVINLSLGWVTAGGAGCGSGEDEPWCETSVSHVSELSDWMDLPSPEAYSGQAANEAVHAALLFAACQGAVVVAAAGNSEDGSCNDQPIAPAVWARYSAPSAAECSQLGATLPEGTGLPAFGTARPLLLPVSAVGHEDAPIFVTRPQSETRLVAPGYFATTGPGMEPLTGTSVSSAVASAAAALLWSYDLEPNPSTLLQRVYDTAVPLDGSSQMIEFGVPSGSDQHRISLCRALDPACQDGGSCTSVYCPPPDVTASALPALHAKVQQQTAALSPVSASLSGLTTDACWSCGSPIGVMLPTTGSAQDFYFFSSCTSSPAAHVPTDRPHLAGPQPDDPPCPDCPFVASETAGGSAAILALDSWYWNSTIEGVTLTLIREEHLPTVVDLTQTPGLIADLQLGYVVRVPFSGVWHTTQEPLRQVSFSLRFSTANDSRSVSNEMLVVHPSQ